MAYDTIRLRSPFFMDVRRRVDGSLYSPSFERIRSQCILREGTDLETGEQLYAIHSGELLGSWDSRISVQPKTEEWQSGADGKTVLVPCLPYLVVEASVHKLMEGHNVYGGPTDFRKACAFFVDLLVQRFGVSMPPADTWTVCRVDVARVYALPLPAIRQFFDGLQLMSFPRRGRKASRYEMAAHFPGKTTTVKFYHKGSEFRVHERSRIRSFFTHYFKTVYPTDSEKCRKAAERKVEALQRLADSRLRAEVGVQDDKLRYDFNGRLPRVSEVHDDYLEAVHVREIERLLREGKQGMTTVRTTQQVMARLNSEYGQVKGLRLYGFWSSLVTIGDEATKRQYSRATYFRNRSDLESAGVSWRGSDVHVVANDSVLPADFVPLPSDLRICTAPARCRLEFMSMNSELLAKAA